MNLEHKRNKQEFLPMQHLAPLCRYFRYEKECPFKDNDKAMFWDAERIYTRDGDTCPIGKANFNEFKTMGMEKVIEGKKIPIYLAVIIYYIAFRYQDFTTKEEQLPIFKILMDKYFEQAGV